jgi:hypothetical protein
VSHPASDAQHLVVRRGGQLVAGPYAHLAPQAGNENLTRDELGLGRIVARVVSDGPLPEAGIAAGTNYVWVDSLTGAFRIVMVPENATQPLVRLAMGFRAHQRAAPLAVESPTARWTAMPEASAPQMCWSCPLLWCYSDLSVTPSAMR